MLNSQPLTKDETMEIQISMLKILGMYVNFDMFRETPTQQLHQKTLKP